MSDPVIQVADGLWVVLKYAFIFVLGILGFNVKNVVAKVDRHEKNHISRDEFNDTVKTIRRESREDFKELHTKVDKLLDRK